MVGDKSSNNTNRLVEISEKIAKTKAVRIESLIDLNIEMLKDKNVKIIAITSGASTPSLITKQVSDFVEKFNKNDESTWVKDVNIDLKRVIPRIRKEGK